MPARSNPPGGGVIWIGPRSLADSDDIGANLSSRGPPRYAARMRFAIVGLRALVLVIVGAACKAEGDSPTSSDDGTTAGGTAATGDTSDPTAPTSDPTASDDAMATDAGEHG